MKIENNRDFWEQLAWNVIYRRNEDERCRDNVFLNYKEAVDFKERIIEERVKNKDFVIEENKENNYIKFPELAIQIVGPYPLYSWKGAMTVIRFERMFGAITDIDKDKEMYQSFGLDQEAEAQAFFKERGCDFKIKNGAEFTYKMIEEQK